MSLEVAVEAVAEIVSLLGGSKVFGTRAPSEVDVLATVQRGLPYQALASFKRRFGLTDAELVQSIDIHPRTLIRRKSEKRLRADESDRLSRLARVAALAVDVLGSQENAIRWLRYPNGALGNIPPLQYLRTDLGARRVEALLHHIDYGDLS
jgi:putative toxin-antitoxin system antitoxin component (TIGR02293 family)